MTVATLKESGFRGQGPATPWAPVILILTLNPDP